MRLDLLRRGGLIGGWSALRQNRPRRQRGAKHLSPSRHMAGRSAIVNQGMTFFRFRNSATSGAPISSSKAVVTPSSALTRWLARSAHAGANQ